VYALVLLQARVDRLVGARLQQRIQSGEHPDPEARGGVAQPLVLKLLRDKIDEVGGLSGVGRRLRAQTERSLPRLVILRLGDEPLVAHQPQNQVATLKRLPRVPVRVVPPG